VINGNWGLGKRGGGSQDGRMVVRKMHWNIEKDDICEGLSTSSTPGTVGFRDIT
jgi:hypothetical protein